MMFESLQHSSLPPQNYPELLEQLKHCMQQLKSQAGDLGNTVEKANEIEPKVIEVTEKNSETEIEIETPETELEDTNIVAESLKTDLEEALDSEFLIDTPIDNSGTISTGIDQKDTEIAFESKILHWNKEVHPELLEAYLSETPEHIINVVTLLHEISRGDINQNSYKNAAYLAHTLKGTSTIVGAETIRDITNKLEFILEQLSNSQSKLSNASALLLTQSAHLLEELYAASLTKQELPANYSEIAEQLLVWQTQLQYEAKAAAKLDHEASQSQSSRSILDFKLPPLQAMLPVVQPSTPFKTKKASRAKLNERNLRVPVSQLDELLHLSNELVSGNTQIRDQVQNLLQERKASNDRNERIRLLLDELEWAVDRQSILSTKKMRGEVQQAQASTAFDSLEMDSFNELHSIMGLLSELISDEREISTGLNRQLRQFRNQLTVQKKTNSELNTSILDMRMEPVQTIVPRLERIIRETCRQTGKQVDFMIEGADLAIDTDILKGLVDPLLHLLRNSIDHGIESAQERKQCNKEEVGNLALSFVQQGNQVLLSIKDDGAGIDAEHIYQQAIRKGLIRQGTRLSYDEKLRLILQAGFSSREQVTELSGRGVGMDVVNSAVKEMSGTLSIHSDIGEGTEIQILLPLTLVAVHTALLEVSGNVVAIPSSNISLIHYLEKDAAKLEKGQWHIDYEDQPLEILSLSKLLGWELTEFNPNINQAILIVDYKQQKYALSIDRILSFQDVVLKTLQPWFSNTLGINGVCLLQNDVVAPVLNIFSLLYDAKQRQAAVHIFHDTQLEQEDTNAHKRLLVVDDSLSNRKALSLMLEPIGYEVITAVDGADALQKVEQQNFALIITDLEMPNINGIELSKALRHQDKTRNIPIIMVTSRSTGKHRKLADEVGINAYLTKPVSLDQLSNSIDDCLHKLEKNNKFKAN
jgi:chemosensory pili system protein ChpA (sensor histidine kinase/response regulator)